MLNSITLLAARFLLAAVFVPNGLMKLANIEGTTGYFAGLGLPLPDMAAWGSGVFELVGGLAIVAGVATRPVALALAAFCVVAGLIGHLGQGGGDPTVAFLHMQSLLKDLGLAGGFLALTAAGAGSISVDGARRR